MIRSALLPRCPEAYGGSLMAKFPLGDFRRFIGGTNVGSFLSCQPVRC